MDRREFTRILREALDTAAHAQLNERERHAYALSLGCECYPDSLAVQHHSARVAALYQWHLDNAC